MNAVSKTEASIPMSYKPTDEEEFMNPVMSAFFKIAHLQAVILTLLYKSEPIVFSA